MNRVNKGFTIVEITIVIAVIGILSVLGLLSIQGVQNRSRDAERSSKITIISEYLEKYYSKNGEYPSCAEMTQSADIITTNVLTGISKSVLTAPGGPEESNSIKCSDPNSTTEFGYIDGITKYTLKYLKSEDNSIASVNSRHSPPLPPESYVKSWGGTADDYNSDLAKTNDGGYVTTGTTWSLSSPYNDILVTKYNLNGDIVWNKTWGGTSNEYGNGIIQDSDGNYIVIGETSSYGAGAVDMVMIKYNSNGDLLWNKTWGSTSQDYGRKIIQNKNGGYTALGTTASFGSGSLDMFVIEYDKDGNLLWNKTYGGTKVDEASSIATAQDGSYIITGYTTSYNDGSIYYDALSIKVNSIGTVLWSRTIGGTAWDEGRSVMVTSDNYYIVNVTTTSNDGGTILTVKYDPSGNMIWNKAWIGSSAETGQSTVESSDNKYVVAGNTSSYGNGGNDVVLIKYDTDGNIIWNKTWGGANNEFPVKIVQLNDGGYVVTGQTSSYGNGGKDTLIAKFNSSGLINSCTSPACQSPVANVGTLSTVTSTRVSSPTVGSSTPSATINTPSATTTMLDTNQLTIVAP